jgi:hypothetical protein
MARAPRIFSAGAIYHVYCRTARGEMVFSDRFEADTFVEPVADVTRLHGFLVLGWALMGNHHHLNLVAARLIDDSAGSEWSGYPALTGKRAARIVDVQAALRGFGGYLKDVREAYLEHVRIVAEARWLGADVRHLPSVAALMHDRISDLSWVPL